jgi:hypothetical protein
MWQATSSAPGQQPAGSARGSSPFAVAQQLEHTERVLEVLTHLLPQIDRWVQMLSNLVTPYLGKSVVKF